MLKKTGESKHPCLTPTAVWKKIIQIDCSEGLRCWVFIQGLDHLDKALTDIEASEYTLEAFVLYCVKGLLEIHEIVEEDTLMLHAFFD